VLPYRWFGRYCAVPSMRMRIRGGGLFCLFRILRGVMMDGWSNGGIMINRGKLKKRGEQLASLPRCTQRISHQVTRDWTPGFEVHNKCLLHVLQSIKIAYLPTVITLVDLIFIITMITIAQRFLLLPYASRGHRISLHALVSHALHAFTRVWRCYYRLQEIRKYWFMAATSGMMLASNFVKIRVAVLE
jgi:hypothetical protein